MGSEKANLRKKPIQVEFEWGANLLAGRPQRNKRLTTSLMGSAYNRVTDLFFDPNPTTTADKALGFLGRLPFALGTTFGNHEFGHLRFKPITIEAPHELKNKYPYYGVSEYNGGLENSLLLSNRMAEQMAQATDFSSGELYFLLKFDNSIQTYVAPFLSYSIMECIDFSCEQEGDASTMSDPYEIRIAIARGNRRDQSLPKDEVRAADVGYSPFLSDIGGIFHLLDPYFYWSLLAMVKGYSGSPPAWFAALPQHHFLETENGPDFSLRWLIPLSVNGLQGDRAMLVLGANTAINNYSTRDNAYGYQLEIKNIPLSKTVDYSLSHSGLVTPEHDYVSQWRASTELQLTGELSLEFGASLKKGNRYLFGTEYFAGYEREWGASFTTGLTYY